MHRPFIRNQQTDLSETSSPISRNLHAGGRKELKEVQKILKQSVTRHLVSDVDVGSFLSGGVDSGLIASLSRCEQTFTVGFEGEGELYDETEDAKKLADMLHIKNHCRIIKKEEFADAVPEVIYYLDEPSGDASAIALYFLAGEAVYPVKYTKEGLFVQDIEGNQLLVDHMEGDPVKNELFRTDNLEVYICENGDHIFLLEWINNMSCFQITGIKVENGQAKARQVLYKSAVGDEVDKVAILDDRMMVIQGSRYSEESDAYSFKSTTLEY